MLIRTLFASLSGLAILNAGAHAEMQCGMEFQAKTSVERTPEGFDTAGFLYLTMQEFNRKFKGYALIVTDKNGNRLGFHREGWAIDPCEPGQDGAIFDLNTESAIGSVTKLFTTVAVLKSETQPHRLNMPLTHYLPFRWKDDANSFYDDVTIADLLRHQAGFKRTGDDHIRVRLSSAAPERGSREREYSNTSMGIFHFIYAKFAFLGALNDEEVALQHKSDSEYDAGMQDETSRLFNLGLYRKIFDPLRISATCDPRQARFPEGQSRYVKFHQVARIYKTASDQEGKVLGSRNRNCASGGLYMSAKDLAKFMSALNDPDFLDPIDRDRMINNGPIDDLMGFWANEDGAENGRTFRHDGVREQLGVESYAVVMRFPNGASAVLLANSEKGSVKVESTLIDAYNLAHTPIFRRNPAVGVSKADDKLDSRKNE